MEAEGDTDKALNAINDLYKRATHWSGLKLHIPAQHTVIAPSKSHQATLVEAKLVEKVSALRSHNHIFGPAPSVDEIVDPIEEWQQEEEELDGSVKGIADLV
jgi:hypothetical protein